VLFGGRSTEHEISVISALQLMEALDPTRYRAVPLYVAPDGRWFTGDGLFDRELYREIARDPRGTLDPGSPVRTRRQRAVTEVTLLPRPGIGGLVPLDATGRPRAALIPIDVCLPAFHGTYG